jgi:hypothetical protein
LGSTFVNTGQIRARLHDGRVTDATIRTVVNNDGEQKLQVDYGHEETAVIKSFGIQVRLVDDIGGQVASLGWK